MTRNLIELSIAVILAGVVSKVVTGFTNFIIMPIIGYFTGGTDFSDKKTVLVEAKDAVMDGDTLIK
jgi:large conductance mechanosensitive channel